MLKALLHHIFLLLSLRHDGRGLPKSTVLIVPIFIIYLGFAVARIHGEPSLLLIIVPSLLMGFNRTVASGYMLASSVIDALAMIFVHIPIVFFGIWEIAILLSLMVKNYAADNKYG